MLDWIAKRLDFPAEQLKRLPLDARWERILVLATGSKAEGAVEIRRPRRGLPCPYGRVSTITCRPSTRSPWYYFKQGPTPASLPAGGATCPALGGAHRRQ